MATPAPILIAGGGIGGLALAIALARAGVASHVVEQRVHASEAGAGIQLGPNGTRSLGVLGVADRLRPLAAAPAAIVIRQGASGRRLQTLPLGDWIAARHGAPYWTLHRADLHAALLAAAASDQLIRLDRGVAVTRAAPAGDHVRVGLADGRELQTPALIGADGLWSTVRACVPGATAPTFTGTCAARAVVAAEHFPADLCTVATGVWLAPNAHVVHYPVRQGREVALVAIFPQSAPAAQGWAAPAATAAVRARLGLFGEPLRGLLAAVEDWRLWDIRHARPAGARVAGRVALTGDAALPIVPYLAQGGAMALEDAVVLADCIAGTPRDIPAALAAYAATRASRVGRVARAARGNGRIYHLAGPFASARNFVLGAVPGERLMARYDWLYGWRPAGVDR